MRSQLFAFEPEASNLIASIIERERPIRLNVMLPIIIRDSAMPKLIITHEVDDVAHWLASPKRAEVFRSVAKNIRTFVGPGKPNRVGLSMDVDDMDAFEAIVKSEAGAAAMKHDGVHPETNFIFVER